MGVGTNTTYFAGTHYEVTNGTVTKYYYAGSQRIAMRTNGTLNYLLGDHLGSTSLTTDANGQVISELRYKPWGETRYSSGSEQTKYGYTGQYSYVSDFGLHFYNARWYDSYLNHFTQPDSIVPDPANPQDWDRYAYAQNNPLRYKDPTGHSYCSYSSSNEDEDCQYVRENKKINDLHKELENFKEPERVDEDDMVNYFWEQLSPDEYELITEYGNGIENGFLALNALDTADDRFDDLLNSPGDAFRHAYWNALLTREFGEDFAMDFTTAHETQYVDTERFSDAREQSFMDLHNNQVGINIALANPNASNAEFQELVMDALVSGKLYVWDGNDIYYSDQCPMCIYP